MSRRNRWLVVTSSFPRHDRDLAGSFVRDWARSLVECGDCVDVLCWRGPSARDRRIQPGLNVEFVPYAWRSAEELFFGAGAPENLERSPTRGLLAVPAMASMVAAASRACRSTDYDAVVGHWLVPGGLVARVVGGLTGTASAVVGHSGGVHLLGELPSVAGRPLARWIAGGPTTVPTEPLRTKLNRIAGADIGPVEVAPMGYRAAPEDRARRDSKQGPLEVGFLGRLVAIKGLPTVLEAIDRLSARGPEVRLEVVGAGPCRDQWEREAGEAVEFVGAKYGRDKWERLRRWDGLVLPSRRRDDGRHEGMPVSVLEAASVGTIPLVSGVPGIEPWLAAPGRQVVGPEPADWVEGLEWLGGLSRQRRAELRGQTRRIVAGLAWPEYGRWWQKWLNQSSTEKEAVCRESPLSSRISTSQSPA